MRTTAVSITGTTLCFNRTGSVVIDAEPDAIAVVDLASSRTLRLAYGGARAVAGFDDQLWIATRDDQLMRVDLSGRVLGEPLALPFAARPVLVPSSFGPAAAVWAAAPAVSFLDDFGTLVQNDLGDVEMAIPITGRRCLIARGPRLTLPSGVTTQLSPNTAVLGGAVMSDGKAVTLLTARDGSRQLVVVSLGDAQVKRRMPTANNVRVAVKGYVAVSQTDHKTLVVTDVRSANERGVITLPREIGDYAIDPAGQRLAVRSVSGELELFELDELLAHAASTRAQAAQADEAMDAATDEARTPAPAADDPRPTPRAISGMSAAPPQPIEPIAAPFSCPTLVALEPRDRVAAVVPEVARAQLDRELRSVALWTLKAITHAWDTRRLGYGNEGKHPYELEVAAILGMGASLAPEYVTAAKEALGAHEHELNLDDSWRAPGTAVGELMLEFGLTHRAVDMLLVIAAAALQGETARLYGILANDPGRPLVDELLVQHVLATRYDRHDLAEELDPRAPLVRLGIVQVSSRRARPFAELSIDPVVLDRLRAIRPALGRGTSVRVSESKLVDLDIPRDVLDRAIAGLAQPSPGPLRMVVAGKLGAGRRTLTAAVAAAAGRDVAVIDCSSLPRNAEAFVHELARSLRRAHLTGFIPCIVNLLEVTFDERAGRDVAAETLRAHPGPIVMIASIGATVPFEAGHLLIELPALPETERRSVWERVLREAGIVVEDLELLAARYKIGPGLIRRAVASVARATPDPLAAIDAFIRQMRDSRLSEYARRVERLASWSNVVLPPDILDSLRELVGRVRHTRQVFDTWGMGRTMTTSRGLTALFQGQPGTGKTLVAGVIARELGLDLYQVDLSKVMSKWIGETERNLATIFDAAEDGQVILLFDEADSLFAKRTEVRSSNDRYANLEVNYLLQRLDSFEGIAILTTNSGTSIDQAFKRRMSFRLSFPFPDEETREQLWRAHLPPELPIAGTLTLDVLARKYQLSGGYIRNACLRAAFLAAQEETSLHQRHLERAVALEFSELGKLSTGGTID